jgi:hypothetical protein
MQAEAQDVVDGALLHNTKRTMLTAESVCMDNALRTGVSCFMNALPQMATDATGTLQAKARYLPCK